MFERLISYLDSIRARDPAPRSRWEILLYPGVWALAYHRLARWLSFARAEAHDDWFTARRDKVEGGGPRSFELDPVETVADFEWQPMVEERFAAVFEGRPVLEIDYEDFAADLAGTALRLADFFGREFGEMVPRSRKTGAKSARDGIANYRELLASVRGTVWEPLVAELEVVEEIPVDGSSA